MISGDAYNEFGAADYKEVRQLAEKLPADTLLKWLKDPNTPAFRYGLYGLMLGHCGKPENAKRSASCSTTRTAAFSSGARRHARRLRPARPQGRLGVPGLVLKDPKKDFSARYAAPARRCASSGRTGRTWSRRPQWCSKPSRLLLAQADIADLPIEDLRKWGVWELTDDVLALADKESHNVIPIVNRAILKFALTAAPKNKAAAAFVEKARQKDAKKVQFLEELIHDEQKPAPPTSK